MKINPVKPTGTNPRAMNWRWRAKRWDEEEKLSENPSIRRKASICLTGVLSKDSAWVEEYRSTGILRIITKDMEDSRVQTFIEKVIEVCPFA